MSKLSSQLETFCREYVFDFDQVRAAAMAPCSPDVINQVSVMTRIGELIEAKQRENKPKRGRPHEFNEDVGKVICDRIATGKSLRSVCLMDDMPDASTVIRWLSQDENFYKQYARAREKQADALFDEALDIADNGSNDWMERYDKKGECIGWQLNGDHVQRSKLRIDTRKWIAGKLAPKKYGDKVLQELSGPDGSPLPPVSVTFVNPKG